MNNKEYYKKEFFKRQLREKCLKRLRDVDVKNAD